MSRPIIVETPACIFVATLATVVWDWLLSISEECSVFHRTGLSLPTLTYFASRLSTLTNCIASLLLFIAPLSQCTTVGYISVGSWEVAVTATAFLFLLRVRAVFHDSKPTRILFEVFLVAVLVTTILLLLPIPFARPSSTMCVLPSSSHAVVASMVPAVFDTFVFLAISWRIAFRAAAVGTTLRARLQRLLSGRSLKALPKAIFHGGQAYYLVTIIFAIMFLVSYNNATIDLCYLFGPPYLAVSNLMACRVFRAVMLCDISDAEGRTVEMTTLLQETVDFRIVSPTVKGPNTSQSRPPNGDSPLDLQQQSFDPLASPDIV
ncbi:hypothetical protein FIBSPDRAFT_1044747 [Athelia psychrophila]|uniref:DUF6533 domain-containing protein n=1 Tax=Athelia psychrophila TaxID=1759441 RepID=A0A166JCT5_9AGAM|nr:hypothetical protein FIBSPDRAFT_1044747 [Fibularhizoctonia sp. CBS 109695]